MSLVRREDSWDAGPEPRCSKSCCLQKVSKSRRASGCHPVADGRGPDTCGNPKIGQSRRVRLCGRARRSCSMYPGDAWGYDSAALGAAANGCQRAARIYNYGFTCRWPTRIRSNMDTPRQVGAQIRNMRQQRSRTVPNPGKAQPTPDRLAAGIPVRDEMPVNGIGLRARR